MFFNCCFTPWLIFGPTLGCSRGLFLVLSSANENAATIMICHIHQRSILAWLVPTYMCQCQLKYRVLRCETFLSVYVFFQFVMGFAFLTCAH